VTIVNSEQASIDRVTRAEAELGRSWLRLEFEPDLERDYDRYSAAQRVREIQFWLLFGLLLRLIGLGNDFSMGGAVADYGLVFRLGIIAPLVLFSFWFLNPRFSALTHDIAATASPYLCVIGLCLLGSIAPEPNAFRYFLLAGVNIVAVNLVMPLRFRHAAVFTGLSVVTYVALAFSGVGGLDPRSVLDVVLLYSVASLVSLGVIWRNDIHDRRAFLANEQIKHQAVALTKANEELQRLLATDALTGVHNRRYLEQVLKAWSEGATGEAQPLGVLMIDVDHFKSYNDLVGHRAGDDCLRDVARAIVDNVRDGDIVTRYGGEEFVVLVPGVSEGASAALGERIRAAVEALELPHPRGRYATVSISVGVAAGAPDGGGALDKLITDADQALYRSKHLGRNRVTTASETAAPATEAPLPSKKSAA
jgi:diguanylate cyclase (GGDEF)-like protein